MKNFISVEDIADTSALVQKVLQLKKASKFSDRIQKTLGLLFFNSSLRTRLSSQKAAQIAGMESIVLDLANSWPLEFMDHAVMNQDKSEHIKEAAPVLSQYCDILGIRCFPGLKDRELDYQEPIIGSFKKHGSVPLINLESATRHPLQGLTDMATIEEHKQTQKPKVLLTWAPHPKALPQSVANSFAAWSLAMGYHLTITHPPGYELDQTITYGAQIELDPQKAYEKADFVYAKNWSSLGKYGQILTHDSSWLVDSQKMAKTNNAFFMHCLPVRRNVVVQDEVIDSSQSLVINQANNRTYAAAAVLNELLKVI